MMVSRILLISTSREFAPQPAVPIGAAWVAEALHLAGFAVRLLDLCFAGEPLTVIDEVLRSFRPDGIGISVRNLDNCDFHHPKSFLPEVKQITDFVKSRSAAPILLGGAGVSIMPLQVLDYLDLEYAVAGEGEQAAVLFFSGFFPPDPALIPGLVCRGGKKTAEVSPAHTVPGTRVVPRLHAWVDTGRYLGFEPVLPVQGKRGCAKSCLYCTYRRIEGGSWRLREAAEVVEEIVMAMGQTGAREFEFVDSIFNEPPGYLETLLEEILSRGVRVKLRVSSLSPKGLSRGQVRLMERAGMGSLVITPESACNTTLAGLGKDFTEDDVHHAAELLSGSGIKALWCFLLGGPREDETTLARTIAFANRSIGRKDGVFITTGVRMYPGTGLHKLALGEGSATASDNLLMPSFYFSPKITPQKAMAMLQGGLAHPERCIFLADTRSRALAPLRRLGTMLRLPSPFWRYAGYLNWLTVKEKTARDRSRSLLPGK